MARVLTCGCFGENAVFGINDNKSFKIIEPLYCPMYGKKSEDREKYLRRKAEEEAARSRMTKLF